MVRTNAMLAFWGLLLVTSINAQTYTTDQIERAVGMLGVRNAIDSICSTSDCPTTFTVKANDGQTICVRTVWTRRVASAPLPARNPQPSTSSPFFVHCPGCEPGEGHTPPSVNIEHIGIPLFNPDLRNITPSPVYDFLEFAALNWKYKVNPNTLYLSKVVFKKGSWQTLLHEKLDTCDCSVSNRDGKLYIVTWTQNGEEVAVVGVPIDYELLYNDTRRNIEKAFLQRLSNYEQLTSSQPSTLNSQPSTLNSQPSTLNSQPSTLNPQLSTLNSQPSTLNSQPSTLNPQLSTPLSSIAPAVSRAKPTLNPQPTEADLKIYGTEGLFVFQGQSHILDELNQNVYYALKTIYEQTDTIIEGRSETISLEGVIPSLVIDTSHPAETLANLMLSDESNTPEADMSIEFHLSNYKRPKVSIPVSMLRSFLRQEGCDIYFATSGTTKDTTKGILFVTNPGKGYNHLFSLRLPISQIENTTPNVHADAYLYIPPIEKNKLYGKTPEKKSGAKIYR